MNNKQVVYKYMEVFYQSGNFDELYNIFSTDLKFEGPLYQYDSAEEYINSLKGSSPDDYDFEIIEEFINENSICLIYKFIKGSKKTVMAQTFLLEAGLIKKIRLVFNAQAIT